MPTGLKVALWIGGIAVACYALNIDPFAILEHIVSAIRNMHNASVSGG